MSNVLLYHGTDLASANQILHHGLDAVLAARHNASGEFWATTNGAWAALFARSNPAGGVPVRLEFELPVLLFQQLLVEQPPVVYFHPPSNYEFLPPCYDLLNRNFINPRVVLLP
jgi:hypothetical protein